MKIKKSCSEIRKDIRETWDLLYDVMSLPLLVLMAVSLGFCLVTMYYADMTVTGPFSVMMWDSLLDGKLFSFYGNCLSSGIAPEGAVYDIGLYLVFAVWNFPVWILNRLAGLGLTSVPSLLWYKILPALFVWMSVNTVRELAKELGAENHAASCAGLFFLLSSMTILPVFVTAQYDSIPLYFILKGLLSYLREDEREQKEFYMWFAVSLILKPLGILILFLLILLKEKNLFHIIADLFRGCWLLILCKVLCSISPDYRVSTGGFLEKHLPDLLQAEISGGYGAVSIFVLGLAVLYLAAYFYDGTSKTCIENRRMAVLFGYGIWAFFCAFGNMTPYWTIYLAPFLVLTMYLGGEKRKHLLLADLVGELCLSVILILKFSWVYGGERTFAYLVLKPLCGRILSGESAVTVAGALRSLGAEEYLPVLEGILLAVLLMTAICAYRSIRDMGENENITEPESYVLAGKLRVNVLNCHIGVRVLLIYGWIMMLLMALKYMV